MHKKEWTRKCLAVSLSHAQAGEQYKRFFVDADANTYKAVTGSYSQGYWTRWMEIVFVIRKSFFFLKFPLKAIDICRIARQLIMDNDSSVPTWFYFNVELDKVPWTREFKSITGIAVCNVSLFRIPVVVLLTLKPLSCGRGKVVLQDYHAVGIRDFRGFPRLGSRSCLNLASVLRTPYLNIYLPSWQSKRLLWVQFCAGGSWVICS